MFSKYHQKAVSKAENRFFLWNVFYSAKNKEFVSCNGHILLVEQADMEYPNDLILNPKTGLPYADQEGAGVRRYPDYRKIIPVSPEVKIDSYSVFKRKTPSRTEPKEIVSFKFGDQERFFNKKLIDIAISFISETGDYTVHAEAELDPFVFRSKGRVAVVMPMNKRVLKNGYIEISSGVEYSPKTEKTKATTIFIAINKDGRIVGAYPEKSDAITASEGGFFVETLLVKKG